MEANNFYQHSMKIETAVDYETQSELNDMKQHADKIIQGIKKLDNNDANRAIWELFQNAIDLSQKCHITIKVTENTFEFSHNGEPFTPMTLDCLFKQVSSKTLEEEKQLYEEKDPVGQYGTGFITTHAFGKELTIEGALIKGDGYVHLSQFVINRFTDNWKELAGRIRDLKKEVASLLNISQIHSFPYPNTRFIYKTITKHNQECASKALSSLKLILPYVMALNPKLESVVVCDLNKKETTYKKKDIYTKNSLRIRPIIINDNEQEICYLQSENEKIIIILPLKPNLEAFDFDESLPRLFLQYPLIGTQNFGVNYLINSRQFQPTEPRTGIYLKSNNDSNEKDEAVNRQLIQEASEIIFNFIKKNASYILSPIKLATINININSDDLLLNDYYKDLKLTWINEFKNYPLVETDTGNLKIIEVLFIHDELLLSEKSFDAIFDLVNFFWGNIPKKHLTKEWTKKINEWGIFEIKYITIKDIVVKIQEATSLAIFTDVENLKKFYEYLIEQDKSAFFNDYKILPNIKGEFRHWNGNESLNSSLNLTQELIEIADIIMPDIPKRHVHPQFKFSLEFADYSRKNFTTDINEHIARLVSDKATSKTLSDDFLQKLIMYCKVSTNVDSTSVPSRMIRLISKYYNENEELIVISFLKEDELDLRPPQRKLLKLFLNDISNLASQSIIDNIDFLKDVISIGANYEAYEEMFQTLAVFPNQLYELKEQGSLSVDDIIPQDIKDLYDNVLKPSFSIRGSLVHQDFQEYIKDKKKKTIRDLTEKIESKFFDEQLHFSIKDHPFKKEILDIIEKTKVERSYEKYYPLILSKRSEILVALADGQDTFSILSLDANRIKKLAELGSNAYFDEIVKLGKEALIKLQQENANFQHKYAIGTHIENILRNSLAKVIKKEIKAEIENIQDGQDIIIKINNQPVYFIEVKSRWNINTPIRMSRNQTLRAFEKKENYALCSVDMTTYAGENRFNIQSVEDIISFIKFDMNIGYEVAHLIDVLNQTNEPDTIHLDGDYRTLIPMKYIERGISLDEFEIFIVEILAKY